MKAMAGCALFGAVKMLSGIKDAFVLQHSVVGCNYGTLILQNVHKNYDVRQASTVIYENEVVYGGHELLAKGIREVDKAFCDDAIKVIFIVSGCVPNMIGDDVEGVMAEVACSKKLVHVKAPGYNGDFDSGAETALLSLLSFVKNCSKTEAPSINILGVSADDPYAEQDVAELQNIMGSKVLVNCSLHDTSIEALEKLNAAHLNIVFGNGVKLAQKLEKSFGVPYIQCKYPYGIHGMIDFLHILEETMQVDFTAECQRLYENGQSLVRKTAYYLSTLYQLPVALVGDKLHLEGMKCFLRDEIGMNIAVCLDVKAGDERNLEQELKSKNAALLLGTGFQRELARKMQLPFVGYCYPLQDQLCLATGLIGGIGTAHLLEMIINSVLQQDYKTDGIYHQLLDGRGDNA